MVNEDENDYDYNSSDEEESVLQRADDAQSDAASFVVRAEASDDESVMQRADNNYDGESNTGSVRVVNDDYSDDEESVMQRANDALSDATSAMMVRAVDDENSNSNSEEEESVMEVVQRPGAGIGDSETSQSESQL